MNNKTQNILLGVLAVGLVGISVAYASLSSNLKISGTAKVATATWNIKFDNMSAGVATGYAALPSSGKFGIQTGSTTVSGDLGTLKAPGDTITYKFKVKNNGSINAKVNSVSTPTLTCVSSSTGSATTASTNFCKGLAYTVQYSDGSAISAGQALAANGGSKDITVKLVNNNNSLATEDIKVTASAMTINYIQSN